MRAAGRLGEIPVPGATPQQALEMLRQELPVVGSLWFPTRVELAAWSDSVSSLYLRQHRDGTVELGPRLGSMQASAMCPVLRASLERGPDTVHLVGVIIPIRATAILMLSWTAALAVWAAWVFPLVASGAEHPSWLVWWGVLATATFGGSWVGWSRGGAALRSALGGLAEGTPTT